MDRNHQTARFIEPMECLPVEEIPQAVAWTYELKLDGYRLEAIKPGRKVLLYPRRGHDLTQRFDYIAHALESLPDETVRAGFVPATRRPVFDAIKHLQIARCPFVNLPEKTAGR